MTCTIAIPSTSFLRSGVAIFNFYAYTLRSKSICSWRCGRFSREISSGSGYIHCRHLYCMFKE